MSGEKQKITLNSSGELDFTDVIDNHHQSHGEFQHHLTPPRDFDPWYNNSGGLNMQDKVSGNH